MDTGTAAISIRRGAEGSLSASRARYKFSVLQPFNMGRVSGFVTVVCAGSDGFAYE